MLTPRQISLVKLAYHGGTDKDLLFLENINAINDRIDAISEKNAQNLTELKDELKKKLELDLEIDPEAVRGAKGEKGADGKDSHVPGPKGERGVAGRDGKDSTVPGPRGEKGDDGEDAPPIDKDEIIAQVLKKIPKPKDGRDGKDGKSGGGGGYSFLQRKLDLVVVSHSDPTRNEQFRHGWQVVLCDSTNNDITVNLPTAHRTNARITYKKIDLTGSNKTTLVPFGSETIDGDATKVISAPNSSLTIVSNGSNWFVL